MASGDHATVTDVAARLITSDRYDERAHRLRVMSQRASDNLSGARHAHQEWADAMAEIDVSIPPLNQIL